MVMLMENAPSSTVRLTVLQGQFKVSAGPRVELSTVLGSCVATCLYDPLVELSTDWTSTAVRWSNSAV